MESASVPKRRQPKPRERNSILRRYYGIKEKNKVVDTQTQEDVRPFDIDGSTFDSSKYFASLLKNKNLKELIEQDNQLVGEIREIDGDMKTLVYENYNKFISATDTIRRMKSNVENMESEMARLSDNVAQISVQSKTISQKLGPNREKIQQLSNVHNSLKRLQFVFELPNRLQHCLNKKKYSQAVKYYSKASKLLNHYQHMAAFKGIERDCAQIMEEVKTDIWGHLTDSQATLQTVADEIKLLLMLGQDAQELQNKYLELQLTALDKETSRKPQPQSISELISTYIRPLEDIVFYFESLFLADNLKEEELTISKTEAQEKGAIKDSLLIAISPYLDSFFDRVTRMIELPQILSDGPLKQSEYLQELKSGIQDSSTSLMSITNLSHRINELVANWETVLIQRKFSSALTELKERIRVFMYSWQSSHENDASEFDANQITHFIGQTLIWITNHLERSCLLSLNDYLDTQNQHTLERIQYGIKCVCMQLAQQLKNVDADLNLNRPSLQMVVLIASRLCYDLADNCIFQLYSVFSFRFCKQQDSRQDPRIATSIDPRVIPDLNDTMDHMLNIGQGLLNDYMMQEGYELATKIQEAYLYSIFSKPVCQVSEVWYLTLNRLKYTERLVDTIYSHNQAQNSSHSPFSTETDDHAADSNGPYSHNLLLSTHSLATAASSSLSETPTRQLGYNDMTMNMMNNIDKLFAERVDIYRKVEPNPIAVCIGLVSIVLKAFLEVTREIQMNTNAYQQIQVDVEFAKRIAWPYVGDEKWAMTMLQEILSNAYTRCASPINLSQDEMALILSS